MGLAVEIHKIAGCKARAGRGTLEKVLNRAWWTTFRDLLVYHLLKSVYFGVSDRHRRNSFVVDG